MLQLYYVVYLFIRYIFIHLFIWYKSITSATLFSVRYRNEFSTISYFDFTCVVHDFLYVKAM